MSTQNPYQPPTSQDDGLPRGAEGGGLPPSIVMSMQRTKPWVTFLAILGFVVTGLLVLLGLAIMAGGGLMRLPQAAGAIYVLVAVIYLFPALFLFRYGASIGRFLHGASIDRLADALDK